MVWSVCVYALGNALYSPYTNCPIHKTLANIKFLTWNLRGIRDKLKRTAVFGCHKSYRADISVLVEMHVTGQLQLALK